MFGLISSELNPSMMCAKWILGRVSHASSFPVFSLNSLLAEFTFESAMVKRVNDNLKSRFLPHLRNIQVKKRSRMIAVLTVKLVPQTGFQEALVMSATQVAGWGVGAMLMVVVYFQHFATVPSPAKPNGNEVFRKSVGLVAQQIASVATPTSSGINQAMISPWSFLRQRHAHLGDEARRAEALMQRCETMAEEAVEHHMQPADVSQVAAELDIARQSGVQTQSLPGGALLRCSTTASRSAHPAPTLLL
jgi:hypothetical protein